MDARTQSQALNLFVAHHALLQRAIAAYPDAWERVWSGDVEREGATHVFGIVERGLLTREQGPLPTKLRDDIVGFAQECDERLEALVVGRVEITDGLVMGPRAVKFARLLILPGEPPSEGEGGRW